MIILDLSSAHRAQIWPNNMPKKIRLTLGKHNRQYDLHPMVRATNWYKELVRRTAKVFPHKRLDWPIGVNDCDIERNGAKIIIS